MKTGTPPSLLLSWPLPILLKGPLPILRMKAQTAVEAIGGDPGTPIHCPWSRFPGPWSLVPGPWSSVPGPWSLVPGAWI